MTKGHYAFIYHSSDGARGDRVDYYHTTEELARKHLAKLERLYLGRFKCFKLSESEEIRP